MIARYTHPEMGAIWSDQRRYETWLEVELAAADAMADAGLVPRDAGNITIYAGCANEAVPEVVELCVGELRGLKQAPVPSTELRRAKDHLKGSLMLSLENTASRMSHLARQEIYFERHFGLDETLSGVERVSAEDVIRVACDLFANGSLAATIVGPSPREMSRAQLDLA